MKEWLKMLFHFHKWKVVSSKELRSYDPHYDFTSIGMRYTMQCEVCGKIHLKDTV